MWNYLSLLVFPKYSFLSTTQLRNLHRNLGHPSVEKQMKIIENADIDCLPEHVQQRLVELVKHCHACQLKQFKPRRFMFSVRGPAVGQFNHHLQIDVVNLIDGNVLHVIDIGTEFQNAGFIGKIDAGTAWKLLRIFWTDIYILELPTTSQQRPEQISIQQGSRIRHQKWVNRKDCADRSA